jgi:hypothetical protein
MTCAIRHHFHRGAALTGLLTVLTLAACSDSDSGRRAATPTATATTALVTLSGTCAVPGSGARGLGACASGTAITAYRCDDRAGCLHHDGATPLGSTTVTSGGGWSMQIPATEADATLFVEAAVAESVVYRGLALDATEAALRRGAQTIPAGVGMIDIAPDSEAAVALLDSYGFDNYSDSGASQVTTAVVQATAGLSYTGLSPEDASELALSTASADPTVMQALQNAAFTPTPTAAPVCCNCGGGCFQDSGSGCGDCTAVEDATCLDAGCATFTPTATPTATLTATATATATPTATGAPPCCDCGSGCFQDTGNGCGECAMVADAVCLGSGCTAFTPTATESSAPTATQTATRTASATATLPPTDTQTPSPTPTITLTPTASGTPTATGTETATATATPTPTAATACQPDTCQTSTDCACETYTSLFAIAHAYNEPTTTVLYRVRVAGWSTGTEWGDGTNGFFYQATVTGNSPATLIYVPFNGMAVDSDGDPALPPFNFIVPVDVTAGSDQTTITIAACASNQQGTMVTNDCGVEEYQPTCDTTLWSETYTAATQPAVGLAPNALNFASLEFSGSNTVSIQNTGVYPGVLTFSPQTSLSTGDQTWLYNHLVFFDTNANPYTNNILDDCSHPSIGVLPIEEAAYAVPGASTYRTKFGNTQEVNNATAPDAQIFFYTWDRQQTTAINVGAQFIYDYSSSCPGWINGGPGSIASTCNPDALSAGIGGIAGGLPNIAPYAQVIPVSTAATFETSPSAQAGTQETRNITITSEDGSSLCQYAVNPLAVNSTSAYNPPNYVIDDSAGSWDAFPQGLSYIVPTGFGTCSSAAPFCETTSDYTAYIPHYADTSGDFGTLNGGSTDQPLIGSFTLADEYALGDIAASTANTLQWFDNCGYGYSYEESGDTDPTLGTRKQLPSPPNSGTTYQYAIENHLPSAIVLGKECCASWYQENTSVTPTAWEPPVQIDNTYGAFISAGQSLSYETLFSDEALVVYDAGTGSQLFKLRLNVSAPAVYACDADDWSVGVGSSSPYEVSIGAAGAYSHGCADVGLCPFGSTLSQTDSTVTCTVTESSFLLGVEEWSAGIANLVDSVQLSAWGATGDANTGYGGAGGFALTVLTPGDFDQSLYAYVGDDGASSVLISQPLSLVTSAVAAVTTDPSTIGVLLIAGGGGSSGAGIDTGGNGGSGATAIANGNPTGDAVSTAGSTGQSDGSGGGTGGNSGGAGDGGSLDGNAGVGGYSSGVGWNDSGSLIPPQSWDAGSGPGGESDCDVTGGKGGGGFGGGGHGHANCSGSGGGGGGGSWAAANTAYDASAPTSAPESPGNDDGDDGAVTLSYSLPAACTASSSSVSCLLSSSPSSVDLQGIATLATFTATLAGQSISIGTDTPLWIRAWGGQGGANDGTLAGGPQGLAQTVTSLASLQSTYGSTTIYYYLGSLGDGSHEAGKGGSSTIVSSADLSSVSACLPPTTSGCTQNILLIAGGGGGAGSDDDGGAGGQAIASYLESSSQGGGSSDDAGGGSAGTGGSDNGTGDGGSAGSDGIGGMGGPVHTSNGPSSLTGWLNDTPSTIGSNGEGGEGKHDSSSGYLGGGGGGGWGGGGGGGAGGSEGHGGGGGGSYAIAATQNVSVPSGSPGTTNGALEIGFILSGD